MCAQLCLTLCDPWAADHQAPLFMEFSRQDYWHGLPFLFPGDLPKPGIKLMSLVSPALAGIFFATTAPPSNNNYYNLIMSIQYKLTEIILSFWRLYPSTAFRTLLLTMMTTPFLLRDFCPHLSYIHPFQSISVHWFLECRHSLLPSPVWLLPNLPWFMDLQYSCLENPMDGGAW